MKRLIRIAQLLAILVVSSILSLSCILDSGGSTGSVQFTIKGAGDTARIYLGTTDGVLAPIGGDKDYLQVSLSPTSTTVTIEGLPAGAEYRAFFSLGCMDEGYFWVDWYDVSSPFEISPGANVEVSLGVLEDTVPLGLDYSPALMNKNVKGVVHDGTDIYAVTSSTLYKGDTVQLMTSLVTLLGAYNIKSVSLGNAMTAGVGTIWLNTNKGIVPSTTGGGLTTNFSTNLGNVTVLESGAFDDGGTWYVYYQSSGGLGGVEDTDPPITSYDWLDIDVSDEIQGKPVHDFVTDNSNNYGYFATVLGAFRLDGRMIDEGTTDFLGEDDFSVPYADFFHVGDYIPVIAIDYDPVNDLFVMGTEDGVWSTAAGQNPVDDPKTLEAGTNGKRFHTVAALEGKWAARSDLYVYVDNGTTITAIPFNVFPDGITGMAWDDDNDTLIVSAEEGLVSIAP